MLFNYEKRQELAAHPVYKDTKDLWKRSGLNTQVLTGNIPYLYTKAHVEPFLPREDWNRFYNQSGVKRQEKIKFSTPSTADNLYYGRTIEDIQYIANSFKDFLIQQNFKYDIPDEIIFNMTYYRIVDVGYILYLRQLGAIQDLNNRADNRVYFAMPKTDMLTAVPMSIVVYDKNSGAIISGLKIHKDSETYVKTPEDVLADKKTINLLGFEPKYVAVNIYGQITSNLPTFDSELSKIWYHIYKWESKGALHSYEKKFNGDFNNSVSLNRVF